MPSFLAPLIRLPQRVLLGLVRAYRLVLSPWLQTGCGYEPTCSHYALQALTRHGAVVGSGLAAWRVLRCHPWCAGGPDPVPDQAPRLFRHLLPEIYPSLHPEAPAVAVRAAEASSLSNTFDRQPSP